ncbi:MAG TPA: acyl-CoA synthetase [Polyangiaceae bacterium]|nr:acyl-CoA synthetase [Polyangiaceae bacterium]
MLSRHRQQTPVAWSREKVTTAAEMRAHVEGFAQLLEPASEGEELLVICRDRYRFAVAVLAAWHRGYSVALPPNPQIETIRAIRARPQVVSGIHDVDGVDRGIDVRDAAVVEAARAAVGRVPFAPLPTPKPSRLLATVYTSGSTGDHVACPKTAAQLLGEARLLSQTFLAGSRAASPGPRFLPMVPCHHIYGLLFGVLVPLVSGGSFYRNTPLHAAEVAAVGPVDVLVSVPAHLRGLLIARHDELPEISTVFSSAAPLPARTASALRERFGWTITEVFGSSETGGIAWRKTGGRGPWTPLPGVTVDAAEDGQMRVTSPFLAPTVEQPYRAGDRIELLDDGRFVHLGRVDGVLKIGGVRVSVAEIERRLLSIDGVKDAGVTSAKVSGPRGHEIRAAVVAPELTIGELRGALRGWLAAVAMPRRILFVEALPRGASGKLRRKDLDALFERPPADGGEP